MTKKAADDNQVVAENRKARQRYTIEEHVEAGLVLTGTEVKALRTGKCQLADAYGFVRGHEAFLVNCHIGAYANGGYISHEPTRERKLLLHRRETLKLKTKLERRGYTLVPLKVYFKNGYAKVEMGLGVGKDLLDRREEIKERETNKEIAKTMKAARRR